ncbi:MAG: hypothetical protein FWB79_04495 [Treponema sp.]|nr:hypothetical protein [Treponema sp.]
MKKTLFAIAMFAICAVSAFSYPDRPRLAILPFIGGTGGVGEAIVTLLSIEPEILGAFYLLPRTAEFDALFAEHSGRLQGPTDSDVIADIGRRLNVDYVLSGSVRRLGDRNLVIATMVSVETFKQVAGYYRAYTFLDEIRAALPSMARLMVASTLSWREAGAPSLAMPPFTVAAGVDQHDAETLSKILAIEILNTGGYVILPRTSILRTTMQLMNFQIDDASIAALGRAVNSDYVLSGGVHVIGALNLVTAQIFRTSDGGILAGASRDYQVIAAGIYLMTEIALLLTDPEGAEERIAELQRERLAAFAEAGAGARPGVFEDPARFWSAGVSGSLPMMESATAGGFTIQATLAPLRFSFLRIGGDFIFGRGTDLGLGFSSRAITPFVHYALFVPIRLPFAEAGWHIGAGAGFTMVSFGIDYDGLGDTSENFAMVDFTTGFNIWRIGVSYTLRTNFSVTTDRLSIGYIHRFSRRSR